MKKSSAKAMNDNLRPEYDLTKLKGRIRGKYYEKAKAGTNLVLIDPDLAQAFPDTDSVNHALRLLVHVSSVVTSSPHSVKARPARRRKQNGEQRGPSSATR